MSKLYPKVKEVGYVISRENRPPSHLEFEFQVDKHADVKVGDYVEVPSERGGIIGKVYELISYSSYFSNIDVIRAHSLYGMRLPGRTQLAQDEIIIARVRIVGIYDENINIEPPCIPPSPGEKVYLIKNEILSKLLGLTSDGIFIGTVWGREDIKVKLDIDTLIRHHIAILGVTGTGKSYTCGVIIEELLEKGVPVIIIDPHGEYSSLMKPNDDPEQIVLLRKMGLRPRGYKIAIYSPLSLNFTTAFNRPLTVKLTDIPPEALAELCNMTEIQEDLLFLAMRKLPEDCTLEQFERLISITAENYGFKDVTLVAIKRRLAVLNQLNILGNGFDAKELVVPGRATIIDLSSDIPERARRALIGIILLKLFNARKRKEIPPFLILVEEAHRFAPQNENTFSKIMLRRIAREGRKFGIGLCIASQRIVGLDKDILSQCGTKFLLRIDSMTDLNFLKPLLEHSSFDEIERLPYLPIGVALVTGISVRYPLLVRIRPRKSKHGGSGESIV